MKLKIILCAISINQSYLLTKYYYKLPSLGIGYIAAVLEKKGYDVSLIDRTLLPQGQDRLVEEIVEQQPDIVGFYCISETFKTVLGILKKIKDKKPSIITVVGGPHVYGLPQETIANDCLDYAFYGEAEESFLKLIENNFQPEKFPSIEGLVFKTETQSRVNPLSLVANLDSLPQPARHLYQPLSLYRPSILAYRRLPATGIITSRGCSHRCVFCHSGKGHFKLRLHSADYVLDEVRSLKKDFGINELIFFDDTFLIDQERAFRICERIIKEKIDISWSCNARINNLNKDLLRIIKRAGCWLVQIGVESGNQEILNTIKKGITLKKVEEACRLASDAGLEVKTYFILGHPGETVGTLNDTISFMTKLPCHYASINFMTPLPGTQLWDETEKYGNFDKKKLEAINYLSNTPAFIPYGLTEEILTSKIREAYLKFYLNPRTIWRYLKTLRDIEAFKRIFFAGMILWGFVFSRFYKRQSGKNEKK